MRSFLLSIFCFLSLLQFGQTSIKGPWTIAGGVSSNNGFKGSSCINLRYISPRFKWSEEYIPEEEINPEKFKNMRLMLEFIYNPPLKVLCAGLNAQYRLMRLKKLSLNITGGLKFLFVPGPDFVSPSYRPGHKDEGYYMNMGLMCQLDLRIIAPFVEFGGDYILTVGTEVNFHKIYRKPKSRYNLRKRSVENN